MKQTRMRTLEEIGEIFGDKVAGHYFGATESELTRMKREALRVGEDGELPGTGDEKDKVDEGSGRTSSSAEEKRVFTEQEIA